MFEDKGHKPFTKAVGLIVAVTQLFGMESIATVGGFLTITVLIGVEVAGPQVLPEMVTLIEYVPGVTKLNEGLGEVALVPLV